ncbi:MAG: PemK family transcriptional regulator [Elusimicrobia bacterium RIFOXYA2_FULL_50_26]|nr:MAG: PemK family transcriptional regulator [Elusimicrobia bacterium RIFOXYA2_FULL_50_26]OGS23146.1 MAG: PemK family transcriptional regulator [Elusimicrobia bacterium RIFOXYB2_FULL_50_12]
MNTKAAPKRGEVWSVCFDPTVGSEITKTRPGIVISSDDVGILPIKLIAPITNWDDRFSKNIWHIKIDHTPANGLSKTSTIDVLQIRGMDVRRFQKKLGQVPASVLDEIAAALGIIVEYQ